MDDPRSNRKRNTALVFIGAGLFILIGHQFGFFLVTAFILLGLGIHQLRSTGNRSGYLLMILGLLIVFGNVFVVVLAAVLISLGYFMLKTRELLHQGEHVLKQKIIHVMRWNKEPWILQDTGIWFVIGEINLDLSLAIPQKEETVIILQGVIGDVDIIVPEGLEISVSASVVFGSMDILQEKETGLFNKIVWQSAGYVENRQKVKLILSYFIGDIRLRVI